MNKDIIINGLKIDKLILETELFKIQQENKLLVELLKEIASNPRNSHFYEAEDLLEDLDVI